MQRAAHTEMKNPHQNQPVVTAGKSIGEAKAAMILVHGRGASAESILDLARYLPHPDMVYLAPQANANSWYPYSFLQPLAQNEPGISSGLQAIDAIVKRLKEVGVSAENIILGGFSQGACLTSEYVARNPQRYGGLLAFSGGVIGPLGMPRSYSGSLEETPIFLGCSDTDFHIPLERVEESAEIFTSLGGNVTKKIYPNMGHTIIEDELDHANNIIRNVLHIA